MRSPEIEIKERRYDVDAVKNRLNAYRDKEREIDVKVERLETLISKMKSIESQRMSDMPKAAGAGSDRMARDLEHKEDLENAINEAIMSQKVEKAAIKEELEQLKLSDEREVIQIRYFDCNGWSDVARIMFGMKPDYERKQDSYLRRVFKIHGSALLHIAMIEEEGTMNLSEKTSEIAN